MHHCLTILEILNHIIKYLSDDGVLDVTSLARVNKSLSEVALDFIWKSPVDLATLLYCFPEDLWYKVPAMRDFRKILVWRFVYLISNIG
jgi:hypothetical protein